MATLTTEENKVAAVAAADAPQVIPNDEAPDASVLKDLCILPPLQKEGTVTWDEMEDAIVLPPIRAEEPVASIRAVLGEVCGYAHLSNFRFVLEERGDRKPKSRSGALPVVSPYTGPDAVVSVPVSVRSLDSEPHLPPPNGNVVPDNGPVVLDEYADLTPLLDKGLKDGSCFRLVLERYDAGAVRDQVTKIRLLLNGNAPVVTTLVEEETVKPSEEDNESQEKQEDARAHSPPNKEKKAEPKILELPANRPVALDGSNLKDFYYLACGEEESLYEKDSPLIEELPKSPKRKKNKGKKKEGETSAPDGLPMSMEATERRLNELEEKTRIKCTVCYSGFHPPPQSRRLLGDLCYIEVIPPDFPDEPVLNITAVPTGFYVNRSSVENGSYTFDPSPAPEPCFSHELLDCMLQASDSIRTAWETALIASKERADLTTLSSRDNPLFPLHRVAVRGNYGGFQHSSTAAVSQDMDSIVLRPSWLVPVPGDLLEEENAWNHNSLHEYNPARAEIDLSSTFGLDVRAGPVRDWNEELQNAREMPKATLLERIERARMIHKVMMDFGEAALLGVKGICENLVAPMNPNEPSRSHVYLHNNIFFSRAIDAGVETFKVSTGDKCARKSASRDAQCMSTMHRLDVVGLHTLATVLVDFLGTRFICQSIVPGILHGDKTHTLLYGAVEATSPLAWDEDMHKLLEENIGKAFMIATRPVLTKPLTEERLELVEKMKVAIPFLPEKEEVEEEKDLPLTRNICGPVEAKGIQGSDKRTYVLDMTRLTPRDANWVPKSKGGTGKWEAVFEESNASNGKKKHVIPESLDEDEWTMALLRPDLITLYTRKEMAEYFNEKEAKGEDGKAEDGTSKSEDTLKENTLQKSDKESSSDVADSKEESSGKNEKPKSKKRELTPEDHEHMKAMRLNVNVFLPNIKSVVEVDESFGPQLDEDVERVRQVSAFLWDTQLPALTNDIREGVNQQPAVDGRSLTEMLHQRGINCRYLGRLAALAATEEHKDRGDDAAQKRGQLGRLPRRTMPLCWLEMLECEMVSRAAKHVLDFYLTENGGVAAAQPAQTVAAFLSALVSTSEETAGETETRLRKEEASSTPDEDDLVALTVFDVGGEGDAVPTPIRSRKEVWDDIEHEVGRRFRYSLSLYNQDGAGSRALYIPLLRRVCQRTGVRLVAKTYAVGGKCLCGAGNTTGGRITPSFPVSPLDIIEIAPLVKHAAAHGTEGFVPCSFSSSMTLPSLHILLPDAKNALESAHVHYGARLLPQALDHAQEAAQLYQRVTDSPLHVSILRCLDLTSAILFEAGEPQLAAGNASRALALSVQLGGFDCSEAVSCHSSMSHILLASGGFVGGVKHLRAAMYLMELMAGPRYSELSSYYNKLGTVYHQLKQPETALRFVQEASRRYSSDRLMEGMLANSMAVVLANLGQYKAAVDSEKRAYQFYAGLLGEQHELTKQCSSSLQDYTKLAVAQGSRQMSEEKIRQEEAAADAIANEIEAEEEQAVKKQKKNKKKRSKK